MTERSESERAELVALAGRLNILALDFEQSGTLRKTMEKAASALRLAAQDQKPPQEPTMKHDLTALADWIERSEYLVTPGTEAMKAIVTALRAAAVQGEPVAWQWNFSGTWHTVDVRDVADPEKYARSFGHPVRPIYLSPPPAAGWDQAIEACKKVAEKWLESFMGGEVYVSRSIVNAIEALRTPAATKSEPIIGGTGFCGHGVMAAICEKCKAPLPDHGGADAGVRVKPLEWVSCNDGSYHDIECRYEITTVGKFFRLVRASMGGAAYCCDADSVEACKETAQYDHEKRILSALSHQPAPLAANASAELSKIANDLSAKQEPLGVQISAEDLEGMYIRSEPSANASAELQNDLGEMLRALGMSDAAQPRSPHKVFQSAIAEMKRQMANASAEARLRGAIHRITSILASCEDDFNRCPQCDYQDDNAIRESNLFLLLKDEIESLSAHPHASDCDKQGGSLIDKNCEPVFTSAKATGWTGQKCPHCKGTGENLSNPMNSGACNKCGGTGDEYVALSAHPHASDCKRVTAPVDVRETAEVSASVHSVDETSQSEGSGRGLITPSSGGSSPPQEATHASDCDKQGER